MQKKGKDSFEGNFSFTVLMNDNIVCQRFFDIPDKMELDPNVFHSINLKRCMDSCDPEKPWKKEGLIHLIKMDLLGKTQQYLKLVAPDGYKTKIDANGNKTLVPITRVKMTGFITNEEAGIDPSQNLSDEEDQDAWTNTVIATDHNITGNVMLSNGRILEKEYLEIENEDFKETISDDESYELKVELKYGDEILYATTWDANVYPRLVRSNINLSNRSPFRDDSKELLKPHNYILHQLTKGRQDLISYILYKLTLVLSKKTNEQGVSVKKYTYPKEYVNAKKRATAYEQDWWVATLPKWREYQSRWS